MSVAIMLSELKCHFTVLKCHFTEIRWHLVRKVHCQTCHPPVTLCHPQTGCKPFVAGHSVTLTPYFIKNCNISFGPCRARPLFTMPRYSYFMIIGRYVLCCTKLRLQQKTPCSAEGCGCPPKSVCLSKLAVGNDSIKRQ